MTRSRVLTGTLGSEVPATGRRLVRVPTDGTPLTAARLPAPPRHGSLAVHPSSGATYYVAGTNTPRLTATNGAGSSSDTVVVTVRN